MQAIRKYLLCFSLCLTILAHPLAAQFPALHFENITTQNGLSNNNVTCLYQDREGFLWIGTTNGLNRYDGNVFETFYSEEGNNNSLSGNLIVDILEDAHGIFWIATKDGGVTRYDPHALKAKQFTQIKNDPNDSTSLYSNRISAMTEYNEDYLLVSAENIVFAFINKKTCAVSYMNAGPNSKNEEIISPEYAHDKPGINNWVHHFAEDEEHFYVSFLGLPRVYIIDKKTHTFLPDTIWGNALTVPDFEVDGNKIWLASWNPGLYIQKINMVPNSTENVQQKLLNIDDELRFVKSYSADILIAGTRSSGLLLVDKNTLNTQLYSRERGNSFSLAGNKTNCMLLDRDHILWVGTSDGLSKYNPRQWQFHETQFSNSFAKEITHFSIYEDGAHILRVLTSEGMYKKSASSDHYELIPLQYKGHKLQPTKIVAFSDGKYMLTTETLSYWYDPSTEKIDLFNPGKYYEKSMGIYHIDPLTRGSYQVRYAYADSINGQLYYIFGVMGWGIGIYDVADDTYYDLIQSQAKNSIKNNLTRVLFKDADNNYWVGTADGLFKWRKAIPIENNFEKFIHIPGDTGSISDNSISAIYEDNKHHLWVTTGKGLNEFDGNKFNAYYPGNPNSNSMYGIYADGSNNLWIGVQGGFEVFNMPSKTFKHIDLPNSEWTLKYPANILKRSNGEWMYGAGNYLISFEPDSFYYDHHFPELYLADFSVMDSSIISTETFNDLNFRHNKNFFQIRFSALQLTEPNTVRYQYQLEGLNDEWVNNRNSGLVSFTSLPPGHYHFNVRVTNPQGEWSTVKTLISFTVMHPYWQQWWFFILIAAVLFLAVYLFVKARENQILKMQSMRNKIANDLHDDVGSALSTISIYTQVIENKMETGDPEIKTILEKISSTSQEMQENMNHIVWSLQPRNDLASQMVFRLRNYASETLQSIHCTLHFTVDDKINQLRFSPAQRKELFLIFKEAIHNIVKYAKCTEVHIAFRKHHDHLIMEITDNGVGFDAQINSPGNGMHSMRERAATLKGELTVRSAPGKGTTITLSFKI